MGKPYRTELAALPGTYVWAKECPIEALARFLRAARSTPLICIGSGGSHSVAHLAARLHQDCFGQLARAATPLDAVSCHLDWRETSVLILTAGGGNPDVLGAYDYFRCAEARAVGVVCCRPNSPLVERANRDRIVHSLALPIPSGKDGFLATNTLLATAVALWRGYSAEARASETLPDRFEDLICPGQTIAGFLSGLRALCSPLWSRETLVLLHGPATGPAAVDIESKFVEAALANVQAADYRNFSHGRHHWLARRANDSAVLALASAADRSLSARTLRQLPAEIPAAVIDFEGDERRVSLTSIVTSLYLAGLAGEASGMDPGAPHVPEFGRKLYHLNAYGGPRATAAARKEQRARTAIERKTRRSFTELERLGMYDEWRYSYDRFLSRLAEAKFRSIVLDFDGTICERVNRFCGISESIASLLAGVLRGGVVLGIASGRGKSVRDDLQRRIPREYWDRVVVGYYNGTDVGLLEDDSLPDKSRPAHPALVSFDQLLRRDRRIQRLVTAPELRPEQLSIAAEGDIAAVWRILSDLLSLSEFSCLRAVCSSHSIDILAPGVTKAKVLDHVRRLDRLATGDPILCLGDRGDFPGNDFELLREPCSLSVDEVSPDPQTCWNLAPRGCVGVPAAEYYLGSLKSGGGALQLCLDKTPGDDR